MRYGLILLVAALGIAIVGCKPKPGPQTMTPVEPVDQEPPFRAADKIAPEPAEPAKEPVFVPTDKEPDVQPDTAAAEPEPTPPAATTRKHTVQKGDKGFMDLARRHLGSEKRWKEIQALNPGVDSRKLRVGQVILLPAK